MTTATSFAIERQAGIGGSDIAAIAGYNPYKNALDVYHEKVDEPVERTPTKAMQRGTFLEPLIAQLYSKRTGRKLRRVKRVFRHREHEWAMGHLDAQILATAKTPTGPLEIKAPGLGVFGRILLEGVPPHIIAQLQWYMTVGGYSWGSYAVFSAERWELLHFDVERDSVIAKHLLEVAERFWTEHVVPRVPPEAVVPEGAIEIPNVGGTLIHREDEVFCRAVEEFREAKSIQESAKVLRERAKMRLKAVAGDYGVYEGGGGRVHYHLRDGRRSFDRRALEQNRPLDYVKVAAYLVDRYGAELTGLREELPQLGLDLSQFETQGKPYEDLRVYALQEEE